MPLLLSTKFYPPPVPAGLVARPQLFEKLDESLAHWLLLVSAPAGAGKTTLVSAWAQLVRKRGLAFSWLSLDEGDNTPKRFLEYLEASLEEGGAQFDGNLHATDGALSEEIGEVASNYPTDAGQPQSVRLETSRQESVLVEYIRGLMNLKQELILILDDYHLIQNPEIHAALGYILKHMPPRLHLILLTRSDPPLELARLRVAGQLVELRMEQLRFSVQEAAALLKKSAGVQLTEADAAALTSRTEGWAAGLQMAAISLRGRDDASAFVTAFAGSHRFVFDYLLEQVLGQQPPEVQAFLLKTSVLERLSAPLSDAILETKGSARLLLDTVERANLFLVPLDDERGWYRYHHLFADLLKLMLEQTYPGLAKELHYRACCWYEAEGMLIEALHHALAADDIELAARIVSANVLMLVEQDEVSLTLQMINSKPRHQYDAFPWLGIAQAWVLASGQIDKASQILDSIEKNLAGQPDSSEHQRLKAHLEAARAYVYSIQGDKVNTIAHAQQAAVQLPLDEIAMRAQNLVIWGDVLSVDGHDPNAMVILEQSLALALQSERPHGIISASLALAMAHMNAGRLRRSYRICSESLTYSENYKKETQRFLPVSSCMYALAARILAEWGEYDQAIQSARTGLALSERWGQLDAVTRCLEFLGRALVFANHLELGWQSLQRARNLAMKVSPWELQMAEIFILDSLLDCEKLEAGEIALQVRRIKECGAPFSTPITARLLLRDNRPDEALAVLDQALSALNGKPSYDIVRLYALRALAFQAAQDEKQALEWLKQALVLAEPENRLATFVREGAPMELILRQARKRSICPEFTRRLLIAFEAQHKPAPARPVEILVEPLSERESEILQLLNGPLSTPEIADQLVVSANTVRTHIKNIYGKLGVHGRSGAVQRAKELTLLG